MGSSCHSKSEEESESCQHVAITFEGQWLSITPEVTHEHKDNVESFNEL